MRPRLLSLIVRRRGLIRVATQGDWVTRFDDEPPDQGIARLVAMHRLIADRIRSVAKADRILQVAVLAMSALTSGALWVLVGLAAPVAGAWVGAGLSTLVTGLTIYQLTIGPSRELEQLNELYAEFGRSLAHVWSDTHSFSWHQFKHLESRYVKLGLGDPSSDQIDDALMASRRLRYWGHA